jgi:hypothetical protein
MNERQESDGAAPPRTRDTFATVLEMVQAETARSVKGTDASAGSPEAVAGIVKAAVRRAVGTGGDLVPAAKAIVIGIVRGAEQRGDAGLLRVTQAARIVIRQTADLGGDLAAATMGVVLGAIASSRDMEVDTAKGASSAARGALDGATDSGSVTVERVLAALRDPIGGIEVAVPKSMAT